MEKAGDLTVRPDLRRKTAMHGVMGMNIGGAGTLERGDDFRLQIAVKAKIGADQIAGRIEYTQRDRTIPEDRGSSST